MSLSNILLKWNSPKRACLKFAHILSTIPPFRKTQRIKLHNLIKIKLANKHITPLFLGWLQIEAFQLLTTIIKAQAKKCDSPKILLVRPDMYQTKSVSSINLITLFIIEKGSNVFQGFCNTAPHAPHAPHISFDSFL